MPKAKALFKELKLGTKFILPNNLLVRKATSVPKDGDDVSATLTHVAKIIKLRKGFRVLTQDDRKFFGYSTFIDPQWAGKEVTISWSHVNEQEKMSFGLTLSS